MIQKTKNVIYDSDYTTFVKNWWYPKFQYTWSIEEKKKGIFDKVVDNVFGVPEKATQEQIQEAQKWGFQENASLEEEIKRIINLPDEQYKDSLLSSKLRTYLMDAEKHYVTTLTDYKTDMAPSYRELKPTYYNISWLFAKTYYAVNYPSYIDFLWTRDLLNVYGKWDLSWFVYPADDAKIQWMLKRRATQLKAEISDYYSRWVTIDTEVEIQYRDVENIRQKLATREERYFESSFYITIYEDDLEKLTTYGKKYEQKISWYWIKIKPAIQRMDEWFFSTVPWWLDDLAIYRSMITTSLWWSFPFMTNDLIESTGILYWYNLHTWSIIIFDRFSHKLPNMNSIILATAWAWKSFTVKLEILRYLLLGIDVIVIDPENEYKWLCEKVWWTYINIAVNSNQTLNPFDLPPKIEDVDYQKWDLLRSQIMSLIWIISVLLGWVSPEEEAILDKAIQATYALKDLTFEKEDVEDKQMPIMEDLLNVLEWMEWWEKLAIKLSKYVTWTFGKLFNNSTNVNLSTWLTVFSIRDLEDALKTPAMFNVLNFIWTKVRAQKKKRLLVVDEAWIMMQNEVSANFLFGLVKRARKYWLGITTISQDVEDFIKSKYWKPIVSNSSLQILLKQSTASIKALAGIFGLSENEKQKLVSSNIWEWLLFAWSQHVAVKILASPQEKQFITTDIR